MAKPSQTMQLDHPRLLLTESSPARRWVFYVVLSALGGLGAWRLPPEEARWDGAWRRDG